MASYEDEHNLPRGSTSTSDPSAGTSRRARLNLSEFFSAISAIDTEASSTTTSSSSSALLSLADAFSHLPTTPFLLTLIDTLHSSASNPATAPRGVPDSFLDTLERVPKSELKDTDDDVCAICSERFLSDPFPLVVRLPCGAGGRGHRFDLECVGAWLRVNSTCPLDRVDLLKKKEPPVVVQKVDDEEEEEWDDNYG